MAKKMNAIEKLIAELCPDLPACRLPDGQGRQGGWSWRRARSSMSIIGMSC